MKKLISLALAALLGTSLLFGCGTAAKEEESKTSSVTTTVKEESKTSTGDAEVEKEVENIVLYHYGSHNCTAADKVIAALNEYSAEKIGVTITFKPLPEREWQATMERVLATKEEADLLWQGSAPVFVNLAESNALLEISELLPNYPELVNVMPEMVWDAVTLDSGKYFVPNYKEFGVGMSIAAPKAIVDAVKEKTGIDWNTIEMNSIWDIGNFEEYILAAMDLGVDMPYPVPGAINFFDWVSRSDSAFECISMPYVIDKTENKVYNLLETPEFKEYQALMQKWNDLGIWKEGLLLSDYKVDDYVQSETYAMYGWITVPNNEDLMNSRWGVDCYIRDITDKVVTSNTGYGSGWTIAGYTKKADACMKWLQLVNTDTTFADMWVYGIEGEQYTREADGTVTKIADSGWSNDVWKATNAWVVSLSNQESADKKEQYTAYNEGAVLSDYFGFRGDFSNVSAEQTASTEVYNNMRKMLTFGIVDDDALADVIAQSKAAGSDKVVAELQKQLDDFLAK